MTVYIFMVGFSLIFGYYNGWQWKDELDGVHDPSKAKKRWKKASVLLRAWAAAGFIAGGFSETRWQDFILGGVVSMPIFDMTINKTAGKNLFYLGTTSDTDKIGKLKWVLYAAFIGAATAIKIMT